MTTRPEQRRAFLQLLVAACVVPIRGLGQSRTLPTGVTIDEGTASYHVFPKGRIQDALEAAARDPVNKTVFVHAGTYRPPARGQALIWFNARHDGITLEAVGDVTLTAANPDVADSNLPSYPAVVNHVVYFGDGVSRKTVLRGFKVTGARAFTTGSGEKSPIESDDIRKTPFFYADGGGLKVYARSYPTIEHVEIYGNYTSPCGAGVSVEHLGQVQESVLFRNCIFRGNRTQITGSAFDLLHGSRAAIENCLFVGNIANLGVDYVGMLGGAEYHSEHGSGALTVFEGSTASVSRSTFTGNWNGAADGDHIGPHPARHARPRSSSSRAWTTTAPEARTSTASSGRTRSPEEFQQGLVTSSTSRTAPGCEARSFTARSTIYAGQSTKDRTRSIRPTRNSMPSSLRGRPNITLSDTGL